MRAAKRGGFASAVPALVAGLLASTPVRAETYYFHNDHLGTPQALTDSSGTVAWQGAYEPFGHVTETVAEVEQNLRFPGQYLDRETALHQNWFRDYDPGIGRYVESDPIGLQGGMNTYAYANNDPIKYTDPSGEIPLPVITGAIGGFIGFGAGFLNPGECQGRLASGLRGAFVGIVTGVFGGAGAGIGSVTRQTLGRAVTSQLTPAQSTGSIVSGTVGSLVANAATGLDVVAQGIDPCKCR